MTEKCVALLGRRDSPTDAVEEYCRHLGDALGVHGFALELVRVDWLEQGWPVALEKLQEQAARWRDCWVLVQYTALAWSERGFPLRFLRVLRALRKAGARIVMVYHDPLPFSGERTIDKLRRRAQLHVMREALRCCERSVFTVPLHKLTWLEKKSGRPVFIPVGANLTNPERAWTAHRRSEQQVPSVIVYGITGGQGGLWEIATIAEALHVVTAQMGHVRLVAVGRNCDSMEKTLKNALQKLPVEVLASGVLPAEEIVEHMAHCDVMLFVRGGISSRRGSAIAGIACGLPLVALAGPETAHPITEAGLVLADPQSPQGLGEALLRVLRDKEYRGALAERSRQAQEKYFSWKAIAASYADTLRSQT